MTTRWSGLDSCGVFALLFLPRFDPLARAAERGERVFESVRQQGHAEEIFPGRALRPLARLGDRAFPLLRLEIAEADPGESDESRGLVDIEVLDELDELAANRRVGTGKDAALAVIRRIGRVGIGADVLAEELARLLDDEAHFRRIDLRHRALGDVDPSHERSFAPVFKGPAEHAAARWPAGDGDCKDRLTARNKCPNRS